MMAELKASGMSQEEILKKTQILMKAFNREDPTATMAEYALISKQKNSALKKNNTSPKDFTLVITFRYIFKKRKEIAVDSSSKNEPNSSYYYYCNRY